MTARREIFKNLYLTYSSSLYVYARRFVESPQVREDIVCDVFARLWLKGESLIPIYNKLLNYLRSRKSAENFAADQVKVPAYAESPEAIYTLDEMYSMSLRCMPSMDFSLL